jgi:hypothetical protein
MVHYSTDFPNNTKRSIDEIFNSATIPFSQTLYGGRSNFTDGGTSDEYDRCDLGDLTWGLFNGVFYGNLPSNVKPFFEGYCEGYKKTYKKYSQLLEGEWTSNSGQGLAIWVKNSNYSDVNTFKTAMSGIKLVYEKDTPDTISTPPTDLKLLQGTNNLTTNGTTITLDYIPNNSIGDAVKASEEYTDRAVERVAPKATLIDTWMISEESDTISVDLTSYDCNFFLLEYLFNSKRGTTLIPRPQGGSFSASVVTYNNGSALYIELDYNPATKELAYTSNITSQFGILAIYTI